MSATTQAPGVITQWQAIQADPGFQKLSPGVQQQVAQQFLTKHVGQTAEWKNGSQAHKQALISAITGTPMPSPQTPIGGAGQAVYDVANNLNTGAQTGDIALLGQNINDALHGKTPGLIRTAQQLVQHPPSPGQVGGALKSTAAQTLQAITHPSVAGVEQLIGNAAASPLSSLLAGVTGGLGDLPELAGTALARGAVPAAVDSAAQAAIAKGAPNLAAALAKAAPIAGHAAAGSAYMGAQAALSGADPQTLLASLGAGAGLGAGLHVAGEVASPLMRALGPKAPPAPEPPQLLLGPGPIYAPGHVPLDAMTAQVGVHPDLLRPVITDPSRLLESGPAFMTLQPNPDVIHAPTGLLPVGVRSAAFTDQFGARPVEPPLGYIPMGPVPPAPHIAGLLPASVPENFGPTINVPPGGFRAPIPDALTAQFGRQPLAGTVAPRYPRIAGLLPERVPINVPPGGFRFQPPVGDSPAMLGQIGARPAGAPLTRLPIGVPGEFGASSDAHLPPSIASKVHANAIHVDANAYQFKGGADVNGVTNRLKGEMKWDPEAIAQNPVLLHQRADGKLYVVDGHQRVALAKRLIAEGHDVPPLDARIIREIDGYGIPEARRRGAITNLQQGTGTALDVAKVLRDRPLNEDEAARIPKMGESATAFRDGRELAKLSPESFSMVANGKVPAYQAAHVGRLLEDPEEQIAALRLLQRAKPESSYKAEQMVREVKAAGFDRQVHQGGLFGDEIMANPLIEHIADIKARVKNMLGSDKSAFGNLIRNDARVRARGNQTNPDANAAALEDARALDELLNTESMRAGPVRDVLKEQAAKLSRGEVDGNDAAKTVLSALESEYRRLRGPVLPRQSSGAVAYHLDGAGAPPDLVDFARQAKNSKATVKKMDYAPVTERQVDEIKALTGYDVSGYQHMIDSSAVNHSYERHGEGEGDTNQEPITPEDFAKIPEIVNTGKIEAFDKHGKPIESRRSGGLRMVRYSKRYNGHYYVVEEIRTGKGRLALTTFYKHKAKGAGVQDASVPAIEGPQTQTRSTRLPDTPAPESSVPENDGPDQPPDGLNRFGPRRGSIRIGREYSPEERLQLERARLERHIALAVDLMQRARPATRRAIEARIAQWRGRIAEIDNGGSAPSGAPPRPTPASMPAPRQAPRPTAGVRPAAAAGIDATEHLNFNRLNLPPAEADRLEILTQEYVAEHGDAHKTPVTQAQVRADAAQIAPAALDHMMSHFDGVTLSPAVRFAARTRLNDITSELTGVEREISQMQARLDSDTSLDPEARVDLFRQLQERRTHAATLDRSAKGYLDVLVPTRSQDGRNLAFHSMMAARSFDTEYWIAHARRVAGGAIPEAAEGRIRSALANGRAAEATLARVVEQLQAAGGPDHPFEQMAADAHRQAGQAPRPGIVTRFLERMRGFIADERGEFNPFGTPAESTPRTRTVGRAPHPDPAIEALLQEGEQAATVMRQVRITVARQMANLEQHGLQQTLSALYKAGLVSGPKTIAKVVSSQWGQMGLEGIARMPASMIDLALSAVTGNRTTQWLAPLQSAAAAQRAFARAGSESLQILRHGLTDEQAAQMDIPRELNSNVPLLGPIANVFTRAVFRSHAAAYHPAAVYAFERSIQEHATLAARAMARHTPGADVGQLAQQLIEHPTPEMQAEAALAGEYATLREPNALATAVSSFKAQLPGWGRLMADFAMPFTHIPVNAMKRVLDYTPIGSGARIAHAVGSLAWRQFQDDAIKSLTPGEQRTIALAFGRGATGTGLMLMGYWLGQNGYMSGLYDKSRSAAQGIAGIIPAAFRIGGQWFPIGEQTPWGNVMVMGATLAQNHALNAEAMAAVSAQTVLDNPMMEGMSNITKLQEDPARGATRYAGQLAQGLVPAFVRQSAPIFDPQNVRRQVATSGLPAITQQVQAAVPLWRNSLPPKLDALGTAHQQLAGGNLAMRAVNAFNPFAPSQDLTNNPVRGELARLNVAPGRTPSQVSYNHVAILLTPDLRRDYQELRGTGYRNLLAEVIADARYRAENDQEKTETLMKVIRLVNEQGRMPFIRGNVAALKPLYQQAAAQQ